MSQPKRTALSQEISNISRSPMVLLPYQQRWCADTSAVKVCEKSRRIGLTWGEAADSALLAAKTNGMNVWYVGYNKDMALEFIHDCGNWAKFYGLVAGEVEETEEVFVDGDDRQRFWRLSFVLRQDTALPPCHLAPTTCVVSKGGSFWTKQLSTKTCQSY